MTDQCAPCQAVDQSCNTNADCCPALTCYGRKCKASLDADATCTLSGDCCSGNCTAGKCVDCREMDQSCSTAPGFTCCGASVGQTLACQGGSCCVPGGASCTQAGDCCTGKTCSAGTCCTLLQQTCSGATDCWPSDQAICSAGKCCKDVGTSCSSPSQCCTNKCTGGYAVPEISCRPVQWQNSCGSDYSCNSPIYAGLNCSNDNEPGTQGLCNDQCRAQYLRCDTTTTCCAGLSCKMYLPSGYTICQP